MQPRPEDVHLVSPWAPSGVAWLLNALLEMGVPIFRDLSRPTWLRDGSGFRLSDHEVDLKRHLPSLSDRDRFEFQTDLRLRWSHEWPTASNTNAPIILCVRDPADAVLSLYRRFHTHQPLSQFLTSPATPMFAPHGFEHGLPTPDEWALFVMLWLRVMSPRVLVVRFEDLKRTPVEALRPVADHLGLTATDDQLAAAAERSSFERAKAAEQRFIAERPSMDVFRANISGALNASRSTFSPDDWRAFSGMAARAGRYFGYTLPTTELCNGAPSLRAVAHDWRSTSPTPDPISLMEHLRAVALEADSTDIPEESRAAGVRALEWVNSLLPHASVDLRQTAWLTALELLEHRAHAAGSYASKAAG